MRLHPRLRDQGTPDPRTVAAKDTALFAGALQLIKRQDAEIARLRAENSTLRALLVETCAVTARTVDEAETVVMARMGGAS